MRKRKEFENTRFDADVLRQAIDYVTAAAENPVRYDLHVSHQDGARWKHDSLEEFLADYRTHESTAYLYIFGDPISLQYEFMARDSTVAVEAPDRSRIEAVFEIFERNAKSAKLPTERVESPSKPTIFIGHGGSDAWRDLKDHLQDKHGYEVEAYETGARAGHAIRDILEEMVANSTFALLVFTGEDEQSDGALRARQNVVHEAGLFQGKLGFPRAIVVMEEGVEAFSNIDGIQYIQFSKGNIKEAFGEVLATIKREFPSS